MTSRDFVYWLQGFFEIDDAGTAGEAQTLSPTQVGIIKRHLALVFKHEIDPSMGDKKHQQELSEAHGPKRGPLDHLKKSDDAAPGDLLIRC